MAAAAFTIIANALAVGKSLADVGKLNKAYSDQFGQVSAMAGLLKDIFVLFKPTDAPKDEVKVKLAEIGKELESVKDAMNNNFQQLQSFIVAQNFFNGTPKRAPLLLKYLADVQNDPGPETEEDFIGYMDKSVRLEDARSVIATLENANTNPLRFAMDNEMPKTEATFAKWEAVIAKILYQFLYIEKFRDGLDGRTTRSTKLEKEINKFQETMEKWREIYQNTNWPAQVQIVLDNTRFAQSHSAVATKILQTLDGWVSNEVFYHVIVYESTSLSDGSQNAFSFKNGTKITTNFSTSKFVISSLKNGMNIVVFRSLNWKNVLESDAQRLRNVQLPLENPIRTKQTFQGYPTQLMLNQFGTFPINFIGVVGKAKSGIEPGVASTFSRLGNGPGRVFNFKTNYLSGANRNEFVVIVGYN